MPRPLLVYTCYADADERLLKDLYNHLALLEKQRLIQVWGENQIRPGETRQAEIDRYLGQADIVLLIISSSFLASDPCNELMQRALTRHNEGKLAVIPILLKPTLWENAPFSHLKPLPSKAVPITSWNDRDEAWLDVVRGISQVVAARGNPQEAAVTPFSPLRPGETPPAELSRPRALTRPGELAPLFAWVHLSDLHFGHGDAGHGWDQVLVTNTLRADLRSMLQKDIPAPSAILVTGDVAYSGDTRPRLDGRPCQEYADAKKFLDGVAQDAGLRPQNIFVVAGNHDVQRSADQDRGVRRLVSALRAGTDPLDDVLAHPADRTLLASRQANFLRFAAAFAPSSSSSAAPPEDRLWWWQQLPTERGLKVRLIGLNTALLAADEQDLGKLRLGKAMLAEALTAPPPQADELVIVMTHHPLRGGWLADQKESEAWVRNSAHIHLCGHVHEADSEDVRSGAGGGFVRIVAGASHDQPAAVPSSVSHGYNLAAILAMPDGSLVLRVWPRRWAHKAKAFRADTDNLPDGQLFAEHPLRLRLTAPPR